MEKGFEHPWKSVWLVFLKFAWKGHHDAYWKHAWNFGTYSMLIAHLSPCFLKVILTWAKKRRIALVYGNWQRVFYPFTHESERT